MVVSIFVKIRNIVKIVKSVDYEHKCFILTEDEKNKRIKKKQLNGFIFFDYEAYQENIIHIANLIIAEKICIKCAEKKECFTSCGVYSFNNNDA